MSDSFSASPAPSTFAVSPLSQGRVAWWTLSAITLAVAISDHGGRYSAAALCWLSVAIASAMVGTYAPQIGPSFFRDAKHALATGTTAMGALWLFGFTTKDMGPAFLRLALCLVAAVAIAILVVRFQKFPKLARFLFPSLLLFQTLLGGLAVYGAHQGEQHSPRFARFHVRNDVQIFNEEAARLLLSGKDPYAVKMPNVMGQDMPFYPPNATDKEGRLPFGYPYMPLGALFLLPGYLLGDHRYAHVFAMIGAAFFLAYARPSPTSKLAATCFLLFPQTVFVLIMSWTEPVPVFFLSATLFCFFRARPWLPLALGCFLCAKQYTVFMLPLLPLLLPEVREWRPLALKSVGVALVLSVPMALWNVAGFYRSAVAMQFRQPFRADSLSYLVGVLKMGGPQLSPVLGFAALLVGLAIAAKKAPRDASGWCAAAAVAYLGFFALNKQAFANYYFWVFGLLVAALAVALPSSTDHVETSRENA